MKSLALTLLVATAAAEEGVTCSTESITEQWSQSAPHNPNTHNHDENGCETACSGVLSSYDDARDACCMAVISNDDGSLATCTLWAVEAGENDIRVEYTDEDNTYYAWAWQAGEAMDDFIVVPEPEPEEDGETEDEDMSFKVTATAIAAATIAMVGI